MAEKLGSVVWYTEGEGEEAQPKVGLPGDDVPEGLSDEEKAQMRQDKRIVPEEWLSDPDPRTGTRLVLPPEEVREREMIARRTPVRAQSDLVFTDQEERERQAKAIEATGQQEQEDSPRESGSEGDQTSGAKAAAGTRESKGK